MGKISTGWRRWWWRMIVTETEMSLIWRKKISLAAIFVVICVVIFTILVQLMTLFLPHWWWLSRWHDDVIKWKHFPRYWPFVRVIHRHRWIPLTKASDAEFWCFLWSIPWINSWINNREAGDLRHHRAHYDVIVMDAVARTGWAPGVYSFIFHFLITTMQSIIVFSWWRHQMETFSALLALCAGIHRSRWIPRTKASDAELWCFLWSGPE